ncbi:hypothetical protein ACPOLB_26210 [Rubrivivax sp. RP6-9]|uniref:hypothetical protein n=1 Tax=Rubrivivax sp. RP6-9 TaxID=3415750 RepID=UPI003CC5B591
MQRLKKQAMAIAWPAFLMAGVLEIVVFSLVDPQSLHWFGGAPVTLSATAVYSLAFFLFWIVIAAAGAMSHLLAESATEINSRSFR